MNGIYVASITPFDGAGSFNPGVLQGLMQRNLDEGAAGFFIGGSSAECFLLTESERTAVFEAAAKFRGKTSLIAHIGAISTAEAIRYAKAAKGFGYDYIAATPPYYYGFSSTETAQYYYDIAAGADMPVMIYNFPANTNRPFDLSDPVTQQLICSDAICAMKHTNLNLHQLERLKNLNPKLFIMNGYDETLAAALILGADGAIGSSFNATLPHFKAIADATLSGERDKALALQVKANNIMEVLSRVGLIAAIKYALETQGIEAGIPRRPFAPLGAEQKRCVDDVLRDNLIR